MTKKEDFKFKLSTTVVFNVQQLFQIQQDCSFLTKTSTKANMANLKILHQSLFGKKKIHISALMFYSLTSNSTNACRSFGIIVTQLK